MSGFRKSQKMQPKRRPTAWAGVSSCLVLLFAFSASAEIPIPDQPLIVGSRIPPNLLFILDNSGSMRDTFLPDGAPGGWMREAAVHNRIYYDPSVNYLPWVDATGAAMTGGQNYYAAYAGTERIPPFDLSLINLGLVDRTFYVPKDLSGDLTDRENFWRYQIHMDGMVVRSEYAARSGSSPNWNRGLDGRNCSTGGGLNWRNCVEATPDVPGRSAEEERANYATWYSYHRTRYKVAKSSVGRAFAEIGGEYRVGYRNIWRSGSTTGSDGGVNWSTNPITPNKPIPVSRNKGLFDNPNGVYGSNNNKTAWYERLYSESGSGSTPLREALFQAGEYFETDTSATGPWGEGTGATSDQFACRLNYTILTTDGYRNDGNWSKPKIGEQDNELGPEITSPTGASYQYVPSRPFSSGHSGNLADIAMAYWKRDLRPDLDNVVPTSPANPAFWQHMVTFSISLGAAGTLNPESDLPALTSGAKSWPYHYGYNQGDNDGAESIDDLWHAAVNGRGRFVMANDAEQFSTALKEALSEIASRDSSFSNVASNSVSLETGTRVFNASYVTGTWTGALTARAIGATGVSATPSWTATMPTWNTRKIFTSQAGLGTTFPTTAQLSLLGRTGSALNYPVTAANNARYIRGDASNEQSNGGVLRNRSTKLGDIIGSSPAYVRDTDTIYVGANDGMLHAFSASSGVELFSYIPGLLDVGLLSTLSRGDYAHKFFVDGPVVVSDRIQTPGQNTLIGSLGRGGRGVFALDVSTPGAATASGVAKWERGATPGGHMGMVLGKPFFANVRSRTSPTVVMGNGINSPSGKAALLVLDASSGTVIAEISTGVGDPVTAPNGLSTATGVFSADGKTLSYVYAGDMRGNVWKFDLTGAAPASWTVSRLFTATNDGGGLQPISGALTVATHPVTKKRWIFFGTGRYLTADDVSTTGATVQSMYGLVDEGSTVARTSLTARTFEVTSASSDGYPVRAFQASAPLPAGSKGWYVNLPESGERIIQDAQLVSSYLVTASMIPSANACNPDGIGYVNALDAFTGTSARGSYFDLDGDGSTSDSTVGAGNRPVGSVNVGGGMPTLPNLLRGSLVVGGTGSGNLRSIRTSTPRWERVSWREVRRD